MMQWFEVAGRSMWPLTAPWQVALGGRDDPLRRGDVVAVVADRPGAVVVHRLRAIDGDRLILRGDTNGYSDEPVARSAVLGRVRAVRLGGLVLTEPRNDASLALLRRVGVAWAELAPRLRLGLRRWRHGSR